MFAQTVQDQQVKALLQDESMKLQDTGVVVSGIAGRFPNADSVNEFEECLLNGVDMLTDNDNTRFECGLWGLPKRAGRIKDLTKFDNEFFNITEKDSNETDYQVRILYEVVYEALLDAGVNPANLRGTNTGVFFGTDCSEFENTCLTDPEAIAVGYFAQHASLTAQYFDLRGMTASYDTACSSGLTALSSAVDAIQQGLIDKAIVASSHISIDPIFFKRQQELKMLSPTGYSAHLDMRANGYARSEACVAIFLQRKPLALRQYCSIMSASTNSDGYTPEGITFPSKLSQEALIQSTKRAAGISTNHVEYIEAHGTGTPVGDPVECEAISNVYFAKDETGLLYERKIGPLLVGSCKANLGHAEGASGLCSLIKVAMMFEHEIIYKSLHFEQANPNIKSLVEGKLKPVEKTMSLRAKIIPISNYGSGGSNAHVIVRSSERCAIKPMEHLIPSEQSTPRLIVMFGRSESLLSNFFDSMLDEQSRHTCNCLTDDFLALVDSISCDKIDRMMNYRGYIIVDRRSSCEKRELSRQIKQCNMQDKLSVGTAKNFSHPQETTERLCNLILPGLGSQWQGMAAGLTRFEPFWSTIKRLSHILIEVDQNIKLGELLTTAKNEELLKSPINGLLTITAFNIALVNIIRDQLQINHLDSIVGHSAGEIGCAYAAGVFDERETILVAYYLGKALADHKHLIEGKMVAVNVSEHEAVKLIEKYKTLRVACVNGPKSTTITGTCEEIDNFCINKLNAESSNIHVTQIDCYNSALHNDFIMDDEIRDIIQAYITKALDTTKYYKRSSTIKWHSSLTGISNSQILLQADARYFAECMCKKVDFYSAVRQLEDDSIALELGPSGIFGSQLRMIKHTKTNHNEQDEMAKFNYTRLTSRSTLADDQVLGILRGLGSLYLYGATFKNLTSFHTRSSEQEDKTTRIIFPLKRKSPSLSSLFKWKKEKDFFVPRFPIKSSKASANMNVVIDIKHERHMYLADHQIDGRILYPAAGYLMLVWEHFSNIINSKNNHMMICKNKLVPVEFSGVQLLRAAVLSSEQATELTISIDQSVGKFQVSEAGGILAHGYIQSPVNIESNMTYNQERELIKGENLNACELEGKDLYTEFRVRGYNYGENFKNILSSSADNRLMRVKYNSHFETFTDSLLQTLIVSMKQYTTTNGLLLPIALEYARFHPNFILKKLAQSDTPFKIHSRTEMVGVETESSMEGIGNEDVKCNKLIGLNECIFDVYCDPSTGVVVTDGVELKGLKIALVSRHTDKQQVSIESYQFIKDVEDPIEEKNLEKLQEKYKQYIQICDSISLNLLAQLCPKKCVQQLENLEHDFNRCLYGLDSNSYQLEEKYLKKYLSSLYNPTNTKQLYDISMNKECKLLSAMDILMKESGQYETVKQVLNKSHIHLSDDLVQSGFLSERLLKSLIEIAVENLCLEKSSLSVLQVNEDGNISLAQSIISILQNIDSPLSINYKYSSSNIENCREKISSDKALAIEFYESDKLESLSRNKELRELDLVIYKDTSCSYVGDEEKDKISSIIGHLEKFVFLKGFIMIGMRQRMSLAERLLLLLEKNSSWLNVTRKEDRNMEKLGLMILELNQMNKNLKLRCDTFISQAEKANLSVVSKKSDSNGCTWLLLRKRKEGFAASAEHDYMTTEPTVIRVTHDNKESISNWLEAIKASFSQSGRNEGQQEAEEGAGSVVEEHRKQSPTVWLCAVETRQQKVSGVIGLMVSLRKEVGSKRLRCFYDSHTFKHCDEPISLRRIQQSYKFSQALERDFVWNCVDSEGNFGSFRHFTINDYFNYEECLSANNCTELATCYNPTAPETQDSQYAYVNLARRGDLSSFSWYKSPIKSLPDNERQDVCTVAYSALNFKDVMLATGRLSLDAIPLEIAAQDCTIGFEFSGTNSENERVMGMVSCRAIATHVYCPRDRSLIIKVPDWLSLAEAATIPVVYATAIMALICRGKMQRGESILIHAGSGGVGQAAIRLAAHYGLTIYTTVGSDEKRKFLLKEFSDCLSDKRIFSSRNCDFEDSIMQMTHGLGVDLVLNSLAGEKLHASIRCLADGGRFLEIGKYDMSVDTQIELNQLDTNKTFHGISLDKLFEPCSTNPIFRHQLEFIIRLINTGFDAGYVKPIIHTTFERHQIEEAFRFMATGKHVGKILININPSIEFYPRPTFSAPCLRECVPRCKISKEKSYIVTGGLGGFGLEVIKWLVSEGASNIVITSRRTITNGYQWMTLQKLASIAGARFLVVDKKVADTTSRNGVEQLCAMALDLSPKGEIGGIFHLAMVLKDSLLENMTAEDFELVCQPKIHTLVHLDQVTRETGLDLDYFVVFSSVSSAKGYAGQTNYAYANSCLERICEHRRADGLHALAIQWGAIGDVGFAFENLGSNDIIVNGTLPQGILSCIEILSKLVCSPFAVCSSYVRANKPISTSTNTTDAVEVILNILGVENESEIREGITLGELGLDSLMAVEVGQYMQRVNDITLGFHEVRTLTTKHIRQLVDKNKLNKEKVVH